MATPRSYGDGTYGSGVYGDGDDAPIPTITRKGGFVQQPGTRLFADSGRANDTPGRRIPNPGRI